MFNRHAMIEAYYSVVKVIVARSPLARMNPNSISLTASLIGVLAGLFFLLGKSATAGILLLTSGILDTLDGTIARLGERDSKFGAALDSSLDRYVEMFVFLGITYHFKDSPMFFWSFLAIMGSMMVSYVRARAQSLGIQKNVGYMQRFERFMILTAGAILNPWGLQAWGTEIIFESSIIILAIGANYTAYQRLIVVKQVEDDLSDPS